MSITGEIKEKLLIILILSLVLAVALILFLTIGRSPRIKVSKPKAISYRISTSKVVGDIVVLQNNLIYIGRAAKAVISSFGILEDIETQEFSVPEFIVIGKTSYWYNPCKESPFDPWVKKVVC